MGEWPGRPTGIALPLLVTLRGLRAATAEAREPEPTRAVHAVHAAARTVASAPDLRVEHLSFAYGSSDEPIVRDLNVTIPYGSHVAIVGPSGIGKSTLVDLLAGLVAPDTGVVRLGGTPVGDLDPRALRRTVTLVPQAAYVFSGTVRENLAYLDPAADTERLMRSAAEIGAVPLIERLGGLDARLSPSVLSAGERQLVALVRAHASPGRVTILDEATNHLGPADEERAERAFANRPGTLVVVAHRLGSAARADLTIVMDEARPEIGTHAGLLTRSACYIRLTDHWLARTTPEQQPASH